MPLRIGTSLGAFPSPGRHTPGEGTRHDGVPPSRGRRLVLEVQEGTARRACGHVAPRGCGGLLRLEGPRVVRVNGAADRRGAVLAAACDMEVRVSLDTRVRGHDVDRPARSVDGDFDLDPAA